MSLWVSLGVIEKTNEFIGDSGSYRGNCLVYG